MATAQIDQRLSDEIDAGVEAAMETVQTERAELDALEAETPAVTEKKDDAVVDETIETPDDSTEVDIEIDDAADGEVEVEAEEADPIPEPEVISDDLLSRAVMAGIPLSEAKQYPNPALLGNVCDRLEAKNTKQDDSDSDDGPAETADIDSNDLLASIPDLDPELYDEQIVDGFKAMKSLVVQQQKTIESMRGNQSTDWFAAQVEGLGTQVQTALKSAPEKRVALRAKFDVLSAGYKAAGEDVERATVFQEAADLTLRDELALASEEDKKQKLAKRSGQHIQRPSGRQPKPTGDVFEEIASEIDNKYFNK
jgi:hypothetical protein